MYMYSKTQGDTVMSLKIRNSCCKEIEIYMRYEEELIACVTNGPYSLLVRVSYFISYSVYARSTFVIFIVCKWRWGCRYFLTSCTSMPCSEAIRLIIR